eukprot:11164072-Lingulodinium_polyedra.AAC.1
MRSWPDRARNTTRSNARLCDANAAPTPKRRCDRNCPNACCDAGHYTASRACNVKDGVATRIRPHF